VNPAEWPDRLSAHQVGLHISATHRCLSGLSDCKANPVRSRSQASRHLPRAGHGKFLDSDGLFEVEFLSHIGTRLGRAWGGVKVSGSRTERYYMR
jgi:hypothetical protein